MKLLLSNTERVLSIAVLVFVGLLYLNTFNHDFVFDDVAVVNGNQYVQKGLAGIPEIFTTGSWFGFNPERNLHIYRPMQLAVLALQYEAFKLNPTGYHVVQILSYAFLCFLVFRLLTRLLERTPNGIWLAFLTTILFAAHPVHTEVVSNIKGNGDLLAMLFGIIALQCLNTYAVRRKLLYLGLCSVFFCIALLFKETVITLFGVAALMLFFFSELKLKHIAFALIPMGFSVGFYLFLRNSVFEGDANSLDATTTNISNVLLLADGWSQEIGLRMYALGKNLQLVVFPYPLLMMYVHNSIPMVEAFEMASLFPALLHCVLVYIFLRNLKPGNLYGFACGFYLVTIFLFSNILFSIPNIVSERWLLLPSLGFCLALAALLLRLGSLQKTAAAVTGSIILFGYIGYTLQRNKAWESNLSLAKTDIENSPFNYNVNSMLANELYRKARENNMDPKLLRQSAEQFERLLRLTPGDYKRQNTLGIIYQALGEHDHAARAFAAAMKHKSPIQDKAAYAHANNLDLAGNCLRALEAWNALEVKLPKNFHVKLGKATALKKLNRLQQAMKSCAEGLIIAPENLPLLGMMGDLWLMQANQKGNPGEDLRQCAAYYERALALKPGQYILANKLGVIYEKLKEHQKAADSFAKAASVRSNIQGKAGFSQAKNLNLAANYEAALSAWGKLEVTYPTNIDVQMGKGDALKALGKHEAATSAYDKAIALIRVLPDQRKYLKTLDEAEQKRSLSFP
jgi:tetratricopeptide (TPR) repeat protein/uncharacterized membrane protein